MFQWFPSKLTSFESQTNGELTIILESLGCYNFFLTLSFRPACFLGMGATTVLAINILHVLLFYATFFRKIISLSCDFISYTTACRDIIVVDYSLILDFKVLNVKETICASSECSLA
mmetsp:Transcript_37885/g.64705  ORF Transcript_37885/g.64705 Transcript_37885/m.64705 type:complete len:117 (-) Transcript_37885:2342-2692(-)